MVIHFIDYLFCTAKGNCWFSTISIILESGIGVDRINMAYNNDSVLIKVNSTLFVTKIVNLEYKHKIFSKCIPFSISEIGD